MLQTVIETDVVVAGGGLAGVCAARRAAEAGARVVLIDKSRAGTSGPTAFAAGDILCWFPDEDQLDKWVQAYLGAGEGLNRREWLERFFDGHYRLVQNLAAGGFPFVRDGQGAFVRRSGRGPLVRTVLAPMLEFQEQNRARCLSLGVKVMDRFCAVEVVMQDGRPVGVAGFDVYEGRPVFVSAGAVVLSAGGCSYRGPFFGQDVVAGEGLAMAFEAGARLAYMEYGNHYNVSLACFDTYGQSKFMAHGGKYVNRLGQAFLENHHALGHRASGNAAVRAMVEEVWAGRGPVYMDLTGFEDQGLAGDLMPNLKLSLEKGGISLFTDKHEVIPAFTGTSNGSSAGAWIDKNCQTSVKGIFAAGDNACKGLVTGACVGISGVSLAWANYTGHTAGDCAAGHALSGKSSLRSGEIPGLPERILGPLGRRGGLRPRDVLLALGEEMARVDVSLIRSEARLAASLSRVRSWRNELEAGAGASDPHELVIWYEARSAASVAEATLLAALERRESRGGHYREDYPEKKAQFDLVLAVENRGGAKTVRPLKETGVIYGDGGKD